MRQHTARYNEMDSNGIGLCGSNVKLGKIHNFLQNAETDTDAPTAPTG